MDAYQVYIFISVLVLALIAILLYIANRRKPEKGLSRLAALSFAFIIAGIIFGENRLVGYSLLGIGVLLAVVDTYYKQTAR
jgi:hypothetical protein